MHRLAAELPGLRRTLHRHRAFRIRQLAELADLDHLDTPGPGPRPPGDPIRGPEGNAPEVRALVEAGARMALHEIEQALRRMEAGTYGRCVRCHAELPVALLRAIPRTRMCLPCQHGGVPLPHSAPASRWTSSGPSAG